MTPTDFAERIKAIRAMNDHTAAIGALAELASENALALMHEDAGPGWWHPDACIDLHDDEHNCLDAGGSIIGWREYVVRAALAQRESRW